MLILILFFDATGTDAIYVVRRANDEMRSATRAESRGGLWWAEGPAFVNDKKVVLSSLRECGPSREPSWLWAGLGTVGEIADAIGEQNEAP